MFSKRAIIIWSLFALAVLTVLGNYILTNFQPNVNYVLFCQLGNYLIPNCYFAHLATWNERLAITPWVWMDIVIHVVPMLLSFKIAWAWKNQQIQEIERDFDNCNRELQNSRAEYMNLLQRHEHLRVLAEYGGIAVPII